MTDLELQDALIKELKKLKIQKLENENWKDYRIFKQDEIYKEDGDLDGDYIIVIIGDEDTDEKGRWVVTIQMSLQIVDEDPKHDGSIALANIMNQIDLHLRKKGIIAGKYEMEPEAHKLFNDECQMEYYQAVYITKWKLPEIEMEGVEALI